MESLSSPFSGVEHRRLGRSRETFHCERPVPPFPEQIPEHRRKYGAPKLRVVRRQIDGRRKAELAKERESVRQEIDGPVVERERGTARAGSVPACMR